MKFPQIRMLLYYLIGLAVMGVTAWLMSGAFPVGPALVSIHWFVALLPAILLSILAGVIFFKTPDGDLEHIEHSFRNRCLYRVCYLLNAAASGLAVGVLLSKQGVALTPDLYAALIPALVLGVALCILYFIPGKIWHKIICILFVVLSVALIIAGFVYWIKISAPMGCVAVFSGLFFLLFPVGTYLAAEHSDPWYCYLAITGFGAFVVILLVVIFILSEGEILDGLDLDLNFGGGKSKKNKP